MIFASADYDGLELRTVAQACILLVGFSRMGEMLNAGVDVHLALAAKVLGITYDEALAHKEDATPAPVGACRDANGIRTWKDLIDQARQACKVANFGFGGGLGAEKFVLFARKQYRVRMSVPEAKALKRDWLSQWPEFSHYFAKISAQVERGEPVQHLFSGRLRGGVRYTNACNGYFQGLGADATGNAAFLISEAQYVPSPCYACKGAANGCDWCRPCHGPGISPMYGSRMVNYVHDDFINECSESWGHYVAHELVRIMVAGAAPYLPDVPATAKPLLQRYWSKDAKQVWVDDATAPGKKGRLVAWPKA